MWGGENPRMLEEMARSEHQLRQQGHRLGHIRAPGPRGWHLLLEVAARVGAVLVIVAVLAALFLLPGLSSG